MKQWYESKLVWLGILTTLLGVLPLAGVYAKVLDPQSAVVVDATIAFVAGVVTVVLRVWFTDAPIEH